MKVCGAAAQEWLLVMYYTFITSEQNEKCFPNDPRDSETHETLRYYSWSPLLALWNHKHAPHWRENKAITLRHNVSLPLCGEFVCMAI